MCLTHTPSHQLHICLNNPLPPQLNNAINTLRVQNQFTYIFIKIMILPVTSDSLQFIKHPPHPHKQHYMNIIVSKTLRFHSSTSDRLKLRHDNDTRATYSELINILEFIEKK